ncbi:hypothetical protein [Flexithrix dorotheae]|uniref:hypothetical protein n=1 Tax=Flexithrix dorotheae TaxID=70993 RepID=UPI0003827EB5|nr:hypothetical protein [Flexithrix dorotheae]
MNKLTPTIKIDLFYFPNVGIFLIFFNRSFGENYIMLIQTEDQTLAILYLNRTLSR